MPDCDQLPVVVAGNICLDIFPFLTLDEGQHLADLLVGGQTVATGPLLVSTGGAVSNVGICLHRLGIPVYLMGCTGDDFLGREIRAVFEGEGLDSNTIRRVEGGSAYTIVLAPPGTDRIFLNYSGPSAVFSVADVDWKVVEQAGVFHLGYPSGLPALLTDGGEPLALMLRRAKEAGATTSVDMSMAPRNSARANLDWPGILAKAMPYVDLMLPSVVEMLFYLRRDLFDEMSEKSGRREVLAVIEAEHVTLVSDILLEMGAKVVGLKVGNKGFYVRTGDPKRFADFGRAAPTDPSNWGCRELWDPGFKPVKIATATGAGDAAVAGFLAAFLRGHTIEATIRYACALGARNLESMDATSSIHSWEEMTHLIDAGWDKNKLPVEHSAWRFDEENGQWIGRRDGRTW